MAQALPSISGRQLMRLLLKDGWEEGGMRTHGIAFRKKDETSRTRITIVPDKTTPLKPGTLADILGPQQSNIGREGLAALIARYKRK